MIGINAVLGFVGGALPTVFEIFKRKQDNKQELAVMALQQKQQVQTDKVRMDMSLLAADSESFAATHESARAAGEYEPSTWLGKFLFDMVAVWRTAMRPWIVTMLVIYYGWVKYQIVVGAIPTITAWTVTELHAAGIWTLNDVALLELGVCFYLGKRSFEKKNSGK
jgi:hypothetical protein